MSSGGDCNNGLVVANIQLPQMPPFSTGRANFTSAIEEIIVNSKEPIKIEDSSPITANGFTGDWINKSENLKFKGIIPIEEYPIFNDATPEMMQKKQENCVKVSQQITYKFLKPQPVVDGDLTIKKEADVVEPEAPPLIIRVEPEQTDEPETLIIREMPPKLPPKKTARVITIPGNLIQAGPRRVIVEKWLSNIKKTAAEFEYHGVETIKYEKTAESSPARALSNVEKLTPTQLDEYNHLMSKAMAKLIQKESEHKVRKDKDVDGLNKKLTKVKIVKNNEQQHHRHHQHHHHHHQCKNRNANCKNQASADFSSHSGSPTIYNQPLHYFSKQNFNNGLSVGNKVASNTHHQHHSHHHSEHKSNKVVSSEHHVHHNHKSTNVVMSTKKLIKNPSTHKIRRALNSRRGFRTHHNHVSKPKHSV